MGRPAELAGPLSSRRRLPRLTSAKAGGALDAHREPEVGGVEVDGRGDVVDHVAHVDGASSIMGGSSFVEST